MKESSVKQFDEAEMESIQLLRELGVERRVATVLVFLSNVEEVGARDIERVTGLHQPEVSLAMSFLRSRGWVSEREIHPGGKGRPHKLYGLTMSMSDIITRLEVQKMKERASVQASFEELKWLGSKFHDKSLGVD